MRLIITFHTGTAELTVNGKIAEGSNVENSSML